MYDADLNLVDNLIDRYSIGDRMPEQVRDSDGGLTLSIQSDASTADPMSNWLPAWEI